jgi:uncharacterized protein YecE (DUF72 family)
MYEFNRHQGGHIAIKCVIIFALSRFKCVSLFMRFGSASGSPPSDYALPPDHPGITRVLGGKKAEHPKVFAGGVLWADERFKGLIYPPDTRPADYVRQYTRQFSTIELNATHYRMPGPDTLQRWSEVAPEGFRFCPKIPREISHAADLLPMIGFHNACTDLFGLLGEKLGPCFMQLPPHFSPARVEELITFLDNSECRRLAVELRHEDWFRAQPAFNRLCNFLYKNTMGLVITDTPGRRDVIHMRLTSRFVLVRFKACGDRQIDRQRMKDWLWRLRAWLETGLEEFYFFIHTEDKTEMPSLAVEFTEDLASVCDIRLTPPRIIRQEPEQLF